MISTNQIQYFLTVAEVGNMSKAAEKLFITQPSLSSAISRMESELNCQLFDRVGGNKIVLNKCGLLLYDRLHNITSQYQMAVQEISDMVDPNRGVIRISTPDICMIEEFMEEFLTANPNLHFVHYCYSIEEIENTKFISQLDFSLNYAPSDDRKLEWDPIIRHPIYALVNRQHPFFERSTITPQELVVQNLALYCHNNEFPDLCLKRLLPYGSPRLVFAGGSLRLMLSCLKTAPNTVCLIPAFQFLMLRRMMQDATTLFNENYRILGIDDPSFDIQLGIITMRSGYISAASQRAIEYLKKRITSVGTEFEKSFIVRNCDDTPPVFF